MALGNVLIDACDDVCSRREVDFAMGPADCHPQSQSTRSVFCQQLEVGGLTLYQEPTPPEAPFQMKCVGHCPPVVSTELKKHSATLRGALQSSKKIVNDEALLALGSCAGRPSAGPIVHLARQQVLRTVRTVAAHGRPPPHAMGIAAVE
eukprot:2278442-Prymnesium_polylepis.1